MANSMKIKIKMLGIIAIATSIETIAYANTNETNQQVEYTAEEAG